MPSRTQGVTTVAVALLFKSHFWASIKKPFTKLKITRESQVWGTVAVALQHLIKNMVSKLGGQGVLISFGGSDCLILCFGQMAPTMAAKGWGWL